MKKPSILFWRSCNNNYRVSWSEYKSVTPKRILKFKYSWRHKVHVSQKILLRQSEFPYLSRIMTKPTKWHGRPAKTLIILGIRPVCSESSLSAWRKLGSLEPTECTAKTLIRLGGCPSWSESSLGAQSFCWFCHVEAHLCLTGNSSMLDVRLKG